MTAAFVTVTAELLGPSLGVPLHSVNTFLAVSFLLALEEAQTYQPALTWCFVSCSSPRVATGPADIIGKQIRPGLLTCTQNSVKLNQRKWSKAGLGQSCFSGPVSQELLTREGSSAVLTGPSQDPWELETITPTPQIN